MCEVSILYLRFMPAGFVKENVTSCLTFVIIVGSFLLSPSLITPMAPPVQSVSHEVTKLNVAMNKRMIKILYFMEEGWGRKWRDEQIKYVKTT